MSLPDFFILGAPKSGTTALHRALEPHPDLFMSPVKEPKFFLCDGPPPRDGGPGDAHSYREWIWQRDAYERLFEKAPPRAMKGESTPLYLADPVALRRISEAVPDARLIAVLRDPVDRAYSNWAHLWADGLEMEDDFVAACALEEQRAEAGWAPFWRYKAIGLYGRQLDHLFSLFPRHQVHLIRYKWLVEDPRGTLDAICRFLGVKEGVLDHIPPENVGTYVEPSRSNEWLRQAYRVGAKAGSLFPPQVWRKASIPLLALIQRHPRHRPELEQEVRGELLSYFLDDSLHVEELTGWDLADWRTYREGGTYSVRRSWAPSRRVAS
jgi:Sulfotransferase domain